MGRLSGLPLQYIPAPTASINSATSPRMNSASASKESHLSTPSMLNLANRQSSAPVFDATSGLEDKANLEVTYDNENTRKFSKQLKTNEKVIACGTVMKHERVMAHTNATNAPKQRRILLVTDLPRLIFIDTIGNVVRGSVEVPSESKMDIKALDGNDFEASIGGTPHRFSCLELPEKDPKVSI